MESLKVWLFNKDQHIHMIAMNYVFIKQHRVPNCAVGITLLFYFFKFQIANLNFLNRTGK
ncbi:hypothetical protein T07_68 [Trichinella nelsoni]|uniref:Uncharacterized protein n=1 Tax=Trichinella nelsoni TaxID=6336 RepID=A0A0V0SJ79_9BILA|nr:hypothetical protein T07_68 [Trichinella nelsoni]